MGLDLRVPAAVLFEHFGVPATVTRPNDTPIVTEGIWVPPKVEADPVGSDRQRLEPRKVLALKRDIVGEPERGTLIVAPEILGGPNRTWEVRGFEEVEADLTRLILKLES